LLLGSLTGVEGLMMMMMMMMMLLFWGSCLLLVLWLAPFQVCTDRLLLLLLLGLPCVSGTVLLTAWWQAVQLPTPSTPAWTTPTGAAAVLSHHPQIQ
jgi:hypothetical protein